MSNIRDIRKRINSIGNTQKVTHAMELISAAKMRKAQTAALSGRPYSAALNQIIEEVRAGSAEISHPLMQKKEAAKQIIILVTSDRGLAAGLNINLFREILRQDIKDAKYIAIGKKATLFASKTNAEMLASFDSEEKDPLTLARTLSKMATDAFTNSETYKVSILYPHFENTTNQIPKWLQLLPIELEEEDQPIAHPRGVQRSNQAHPGGESSPIVDLLFEPDAQTIFKNLLPHFILTRIYQILLEAKASEHSARMVAMKNATDAAGDLIDDLTLTYNQARQEAITKELLDIVTAQRAFE